MGSRPAVRVSTVVLGLVVLALSLAAVAVLARPSGATGPAAPQERVSVRSFQGAGPGIQPAAAPTATAAGAAEQADPRAAWLLAVASGVPRPPAAVPAPAAPIAAEPPPGGEAPTVQQAASPVRVVVYTTSWCPHCKRARGWLTANRIPFEERNIQLSPAYATENRSLNPSGSIPTFDVDGEVMVGFSESGLLALIQRAARRRATFN